MSSAGRRSPAKATQKRKACNIQTIFGSWDYAHASFAGLAGNERVCHVGIISGVYSLLSPSEAAQHALWGQKAVNNSRAPCLESRALF